MRVKLSFENFSMALGKDVDFSLGDDKLEVAVDKSLSWVRRKM